MIQAIETRYAGCHFRSRTEAARWAVCFDHLGIRWQYEHQGFECLPRLSQFGWLDAAEKIPYLPDFWFPDFELHGEVKPTMTDADLFRLLDCAASLSTNDEMYCGRGHDLVVFGEIPRPDSDRLPTALHMHDGYLQASAWMPGWPESYLHHDDARSIAYDCAGDLADVLIPVDPIRGNESADITSARLIRWLTRGTWGSLFYPYWVDGSWERWMAACAAARSARFEHGQSGAT